ncbi:MAG: putative ABC transporter permease [Bacilli bacterium]|nr:putative ABC transporter permease [Bacilli bacterium]MDD4547429.1 putative ABC transporter permease [Bacilli bacterium]
MNWFLFYYSLFMIYSFFGWVFETFFVSLGKKKFANRGFLIGPYCPIYGLSAVFIILLASKYKENFLLLFIIIMLIAAIVEYLTSYIMEKAFRARWWDYSTQRFNLNGRICLQNLIFFGLLGSFMIYILNPPLTNFINNLDIKTVTILTIIVGFIFIVDVVVSFKVIRKIKTTAEVLKKDYTDEITEKVKEILLSKSLLTKRLIKAFPNIKSINVRIGKKNKNK